MSEWIEVDGAENIPLGVWLVTTNERGNREKEIHTAKVRSNFITVGNQFYFDMPKVIAYMPAPSPFTPSDK